jgi:DNA-binding MarR family transcriptional regulator
VASRENRGQLYETLAHRAGVDLPARSCWLLYRLADRPACTVQEVAARLKVDSAIIQPAVDGLLTAGMIAEVHRGDECDLTLTPTGTAAIESLTEARRTGLTELLEGWSPREHPEVIDMVKHLASALLADDERLVEDALPRVPAGAGGSGPS